MFYKKNHITLYYEKIGNKKKNLIILPGWGNTRQTFQSIIESLKGKYTIYIIDYPGFGNSPIPTKVLTIEDYAELIHVWIKEKEIKNPSILAHSFGGRITSLLIAKYNCKMDKLVLMDVAGIRHHKITTFLKQLFYKGLKKSLLLLPRKKRKEAEKKLFQFFSSTDYQEIPPIMRKTFQNIVKKDLKKYYKKISIEALILWGEKDLDTPLKDAYYLQKHLKESALIIFPKASHFSYLDYPLLTNNILNKYL